MVSRDCPVTVTTRVLLTGATGNWGRAALQAFESRSERVEVLAFCLPTDHDRKILAKFSKMANLEVVFGDLTDPLAVAAAVERVDLVLHVAAVVSPTADRHPKLAWRVNVESMKNIIAAVRDVAERTDRVIGVVGIGSVAETGNRNPPVHWGRVGDPLRVSQYDEYGQTKVVAERLLVDSGLPRWAWLRQTGIFHPGLLDVRDPIVTHVPLGAVMEWASDVDSARLLVNLCEADVPDEFWCNVYNIGGGAEWRLTNWHFQELLLGGLGVDDPRQWYDRDWFATKNFHGHWFTDSDRLNDLVPFRQDTLSAALERVMAAQSLTTKLSARLPGGIIKWAMRRTARQPRGTLYFLDNDNREAIRAYFGSREAWERIGDWSTFVVPDPSKVPVQLDHGYDESLAPTSWTIDDLRGAARFRGGELESVDVDNGSIGAILTWKCALGHRFEASPRLILLAGHWCPTCVRDSAHYDVQAKNNPFLAQVQLIDEQAVA